MKKLGILLMAFLAMSLSSVLAVDPTGFMYTNIGTATGDWKYMGGWVAGNYPTAQVTATGYSPLATFGTLAKTEVLGQPWKYALALTATANAPTTFQNLMHVETVNDPATTPATGGYTKYAYSENTFGVFSGSSLSVSGYGWSDVTSTVIVESAAQQAVGAGINQ